MASGSDPSDRPALRTWAGLFVLQTIGFAVAGGTVALATAVVPPPVYGRYALMLSLVQITAALVFSWLNQSALRFGREEYTSTGSIGRTAGSLVAIEMVLAVPVILVSLLLGRSIATLAGLASPEFVLLFLALAAFVISESTSYLAQSTGRFAGYGVSQLVSKACPLIVLLAIAAGFTASPQILLGGMIAGSALAAATTISRVPKSARRPVAVDRPLLARLIGYGWRLPLATASGMLVAWMGQWFVRGYVGIEAAGQYAWAYSLFGLSTAILTPISAILAPRMIDLHLSRSVTAMASTVATVRAMYALVAAIMPVLLVVFRLVAAAIIPTAYMHAVGPATILCGLAALQVLNYALSPLLMANERMVGGMVAINVAVALVNAIGDWILVPRIGLEGAAIGTGVALYFSNIAYAMLAQRGSGLARDARLISITQIGLIGGIVIAFATAIGLAESLPGLAAIVVGSLLLLPCMRHLGLMREASNLVGELSPLPRAIRVPVSALLQWCDGPDRRPAKV